MGASGRESSARCEGFVHARLQSHSQPSIAKVSVSDSRGMVFDDARGLSASAMQKPWNAVKIMETTYFL